MKKDLGSLGKSTEDEELNIINQLLSRANLTGTSVRKSISDMEVGYDYYDTEILLNGVLVGGLSQHYYRGKLQVLALNLKIAILICRFHFK